MSFCVQGNARYYSWKGINNSQISPNLRNAFGRKPSLGTSVACFAFLPLDGFVFGGPEFNSSTLCKIVPMHLVSLCQLGFLTSFCLIYNICFLRFTVSSISTAVLDT